MNITKKFISFFAKKRIIFFTKIITFEKKNGKIGNYLKGYFLLNYILYVIDSEERDLRGKQILGYVSDFQ